MTSSAHLPTWISLINVAAPAVYGATFCSLIAVAPKNFNLGRVIMAAGMGCHAGYLLVAALMATFDSFSLPMLHPNFAFSLLVLSVIQIILLIGLASNRHNNLTAEGFRRHWHAFPFFIVIVVLSVLSLWTQAVLPPLGWDFLDWYGINASRMIDQEIHAYGRHSPFYYAYSYQYIQPLTTTYIAAYSALFASTNLLSVGGLLPWAIAWLGLVLSVIGFTLWHYRNITAAGITGSAVLAVPLLENHMLIAGYIEIWLTCAVTTAVLLIASGYIRKSALLILLGLLYSFCFFKIKNTGILYWISLFVAWFILFLLSLTPRTRAGLVCLPLLIIISVCVSGFDFDFLGYRFAIVHDAQTEFHFGGRVWDLSFHSLKEILQNFSYALFVNSSFSIVYSGFLFCAVHCCYTIATVESPSRYLLASFFICYAVIRGCTVNFRVCI